MAKHLPSIRCMASLKNIRKKFEKLCKKKGFPRASTMGQGNNHFRWACSNCGESVERLQDMWTSLLYHIRNIHEWSDSICVHMCSCTTNCPRNSGKKWVSGTSSAYAALQSIVLDA